jgi:hypothetical protein
MKNLLKKIFTRIYTKWILKTKYKDYIRTEGEKTALTICRHLITHNSSKFLIAPLSGKRYIKNEELGLFLILDEKLVSITNHLYHYEINVNQRDWDRIVLMYDNKTERIRQQFEDEIMMQIQHSLIDIKNKVENSKFGNDSSN